ncbi:hypothetical protein D3C81_528390 [compost metagenome]
MSAARLGQFADIEGQAPGLNHAAVAPASGRQGQPTAGDQIAATVGDIRRGDIEGTGPAVQHRTIEVAQACCVQRQITVADLYLAVTVIEPTTNLKVALARYAQGAQLATLIVHCRRRHQQSSVALDNT